MGRAVHGARAVGGGGRIAGACLLPVALLVARGALAVTHPAVTVLCGGGPAEAPVSCRAYVSAFSSAAYPVATIAPERWERARDTIVVVPGVAAAALPDEVRTALVRFVEAGGKLVTALDTPLARALGVVSANAEVAVTGATDDFRTELAIRWRSAARLRPFTAPTGGRVFTRTPDRTRALVASFGRGAGTVLFLGVELDEESPLGTSRFPYFLQAVGAAFDAAPALASARVVAYADLGDHKGRDPEAIAAEWRRRGVREVHLGTWDAWEGAWERYERLIAACHRRGILVYAWFELPEVTKQFWDAHPGWREKTATGADAHVDWRRLMALAIPECFEAVARWASEVLDRLDWDGADLAEVYFESPMGLDRPDLFTPLNRADREAFRARAGFDPAELFDPASPRHFRTDAGALAAFLAYRRDRAVELHERLLALLASARAHKPHLDLVLTLVDALYDERMGDRLGIDTRRITALGARFPFELQVEDPFTLWGLGPERYTKIARDYAGLVRPGERLAVDINVVPRQGDVFPTAQQTGLDLYALVAAARRGFPKVCLYSEATVYRQDAALLRSALAATARVERTGPRAAVVESDGIVELAIGTGQAAVTLDGRAWPALRDGAVLLPSGRHAVAWGRGAPPSRPPRLRGLTGVLLDAEAVGAALIVRYAAPARAWAELSFAPSRVEVDGVPVPVSALASGRSFIVALPPGTHVAHLAP